MRGSYNNSPPPPLSLHFSILTSLRVYTFGGSRLVFPVPVGVAGGRSERGEKKEESVWREAHTTNESDAVASAKHGCAFSPLFFFFFFKRGQVVLCITIKSPPPSPHMHTLLYIQMRARSHAHIHPTRALGSPTHLVFKSVFQFDSIILMRFFFFC